MPQFNTISIHFHTLTFSSILSFHPPCQPSLLACVPSVTPFIDFTSDGPSHSLEGPLRLHVRLAISPRPDRLSAERGGWRGVAEARDAPSELRPQLWHPGAQAAHQQQGGTRSRQDCLVEGRGYPPQGWYLMKAEKNWFLIIILWSTDLFKLCFFSCLTYVSHFMMFFFSLILCLKAKITAVVIKRQTILFLATDSHSTIFLTFVLNLNVSLFFCVWFYLSRFPRGQPPSLQPLLERIPQMVVWVWALAPVPSSYGPGKDQNRKLA